MPEVKLLNYMSELACGTPNLPGASLEQIKGAGLELDEAEEAVVLRAKAKDTGEELFRVSVAVSAVMYDAASDAVVVPTS